MKNLLFSALIMLFAIFGVAQTQDGPIKEDLKQRVIERVHTDISDKNFWELKANFPELRLKGDRPANGFSKAAKMMAMKHVNEFKKSMTKITDEERSFLPKGVNYYQEINFYVELLSDEFVSVKFVRSEFTGGAHPNSWSFTLNYDLKKDKAVKLPELFEYSSYLEEISEESIKQLVKLQGENSATDWIKAGAGEDLKNYSSWNLTQRGLKFTFDPYQVASYAAGPSETIVKFSKFIYAVRSDTFKRMIDATYIDGNPASWCRNGHFPSYKVDFRLARIKGKKNTRSYFYKDSDDCPDGINCREKAYVIAGDEVIVAREYGDYSCVWFQPRNGSETVGWLKTSDLLSNKTPVKPGRANWLGDWRFAGNNIKLIPEKTLGDFLITGNALWKGLGDNVHIGELNFSGTPDKSKLEAGTGSDKYDCRVKMQRLGRYLIVSDNKNCGGVNVTFDGVYLRK